MTAFKQYGAEATDSEVVRETELLFVKSTFNIAEEKRIWKQILKTSPWQGPRKGKRRTMAITLDRHKKPVYKVLQHADGYNYKYAKAN